MGGEGQPGGDAVLRYDKVHIKVYKHMIYRLAMLRTCICIVHCNMYIYTTHME